jgi:MYXO-CTERM domain-containing protein
MRAKTILTLVVGLAALWSTRAHASEVFPGALQEAADMQCVPVCTMCHTGTPGITTWTMKPLPVALMGTHLVKIGDTDSLKAAYKVFAATADPAMLADIKAGREPGSRADVCGPTYGCGAHVAKEAAAPRDFTGPLWIVGAMVVGGILRRRRKPNGR